MQYTSSDFKFTSNFSVSECRLSVNVGEISDSDNILGAELHFHHRRLDAKQRRFLGKRKFYKVKECN